MPSIKKIIKGVGIVAAVLAVSYVFEIPKYHFEKIAREAAAGLPGTRLIQIAKTVDVEFPISWVKPPIVMLNFAMPDPLMRGRFFMINFNYSEKDPDSFLLDADCKTQKWAMYDLDQPSSAFPAIDLWGEDVVAPNGKTYRLVKSDNDLPSEWFSAFCKSDWTGERKAIADSIHQSEK